MRGQDGYLPHPAAVLSGALPGHCGMNGLTPLVTCLALPRAVAPGTRVSSAGSEIARGQTLLRKATLPGAREVAMLATVGPDRVGVWRRPRVAVLPGPPTSAMFTFHDLVAPARRPMAGLPMRGAARVAATLPVRLTSELGRTEFAMVALTEGPAGLVAHPVAKGSGAVTAFAQAESVAPGTQAEVMLFGAAVAPPRLAIVGSHCVGSDAVTGRPADRGLSARILATGSQGGLAALRRRDCDIDLIHLLHAESASPIAALASDRAGSVSGTEVGIDGGTVPTA